jgi:hypothetical protein
MNPVVVDDAPVDEADQILLRWKDDAAAMPPQLKFVRARTSRSSIDDAELRFVTVSAWTSRNDVGAARGGVHYSLTAATLRPAPARELPLLLAARGKRMIDIAAAFADAVVPSVSLKGNSPNDFDGSKPPRAHASPISNWRCGSVTCPVNTTQPRCSTPWPVRPRPWRTTSWRSAKSSESPTSSSSSSSTTTPPTS